MPTGIPGMEPRPASLESGVQLQSRYHIQHRSDMLMEEQIHLVRSTQIELKTALHQLEHSKTSTDMNKYRLVVQELKERSEKQVLSLKVLHKINTELAFAREDLDNALYAGEGDINAARKRVVWLEDRMGLLCGKIRLRGQPTPRQLAKMPKNHSRSMEFDSSDEEDTERRTKNKVRHRAGRYSNLSTRSSSGEPISLALLKPHRLSTGRSTSDSCPSSGYPVMSPPRRGPGIMDTSSSEDEGGPFITRYRKDVSGSESDHSGPVMQRSEINEFLDAEIKPDNMEKLSDVPEVSEYDRVSKTIVSTESDAVSDKARARSYGDCSVSIDGKDVIEDPKMYQKTSDKGEHLPPVDSDKEKEIIRSGAVSPSSGRDSYERGSEGSPEDTDEDKPKPKDETFLTEISHITNKSRVSFKSPVNENYADGPDNQEQILSLGRQYWNSEHHRFQYSEMADLLVEVDPLSYHQVGLAVPGNFLDKEDKNYEPLPWRPHRKGSDIEDVHKTALNKLANRLHHMYDKVYDAALLSVKPSEDEDAHGRERSFLQSVDLIQSSLEGSSSKKQTPDSGQPPGTTEAADVFVLPPVEKKRSGALGAGRLIYYPKPIPPPQVLPLTRISAGKEYPREADAYADPDPTTRKPADRIADQRNLMEETKLVLFKEKVKAKQSRHSSMEKRFQKMLERDRSTSSRSSRSSATPPEIEKKLTKEELRRKLRVGIGFAKAISKMQDGGDATSDTDSEVSNWDKMKPKSGRQYSGLKWERVKNIVHNNLVSDRVEERRDGAKHLGLLRSGDAMVLYALKGRMKNDTDERVRYESAKSLISIGCWEEEIIQVILKYLVIGNNEVRADIIHTMCEGKNVHYVNKRLAVFPELVKVLSHFCSNPDPEDPIAFEAAVLLGKFCVADNNAKARLLRILDEDQTTQVKAKSIEILVKQFNIRDESMVHHMIALFKDSPVWKYRVLAANLLITLGQNHPVVKKEHDKIFELLERRLWDDPSKEVRLTAAKALTALGMFSVACEGIEKRLEDTSEDIRAQAVISVGTLGMKNDKIIRLLLEMLELDSSEFVRLMIIRTFAALNLTDKRVLRTLREREKQDGSLARESRKALKILEVALQTGPVKSTTPATALSMMKAVVTS